MAAGAAHPLRSSVTQYSFWLRPFFGNASKPCNRNVALISSFKINFVQKRKHTTGWTAQQNRKKFEKRIWFEFVGCFRCLLVGIGWFLPEGPLETSERCHNSGLAHVSSWPSLLAQLVSVDFASRPPFLVAALCAATRPAPCTNSCHRGRNSAGSVRNRSLSGASARVVHGQSSGSSSCGD